MGLDAQEQSFIDKTLIELTGPTTSRVSAPTPFSRCPWRSRKRRRRNRAPALPVFRRLGRNADAGTDDERHQRRAHASNNLDIQEFMIVRSVPPAFAKRCAAVRRSSTR